MSDIISVDNLIKFAPIITALITSFILFISCIIAYKALRLQKELKKIDVLLFFQNRFNALVYEDNSNIRTREDVVVFYEKFWLIQKDQYRLWKKGFLEDTVFLRWITTIKKDFQQHRSYGNIPPDLQASFLEGWKTSKDAMLDNKFVNFIEILQYYTPKDSIKALKSNWKMKRLLKDT